MFRVPQLLFQPVPFFHFFLALFRKLVGMSDSEFPVKRIKSRLVETTARIAPNIGWLNEAIPPISYFLVGLTATLFWL